MFFLYVPIQTHKIIVFLAFFPGGVSPKLVACPRLGPHGRQHAVMRQAIAVGPAGSLETGTLGLKMVDYLVAHTKYHLVMTNIAMENITIFNR